MRFEGLFRLKRALWIRKGQGKRGRATKRRMGFSRKERAQLKIFEIIEITAMSEQKRGTIREGSHWRWDLQDRPKKTPILRVDLQSPTQKRRLSHP